MLRDLGDLRLKQKAPSLWDSRKGPSQGLRYRSGMPPAPPTWHYSRDDLRAYDRWEKRVKVWEMQVSSYLPPNEAAMNLFVSLKGEAEEELENADLAKINHKNGIEFILSTLRTALKTRAIYQKRKYMHDFEQVSRFSNEGVRAFCNRYHRVERALQACGVDIEPMYDSEARGARLLERLRLSPEQQRMILIGAGHSLHFEAVKEAAQLQFPDHRPVPQVVFTKEFDGHGGQGHSRYVPEARPDPKGKGKDKFSRRPPPKGSGKGHHTFVTEAPEAHDQDDALEGLAEIPEEDEQEAENPEGGEAEDDDELVPDDGTEDATDLADAVLQAAGVLTVTARRLQGVKLGRKFSGPKASIEERKKRSTCAACGQTGHWKNDDICPMAKPKAQPKAKASGKGTGSSSKVMIVRAEGNQEADLAEDAEIEAEQASFGSYFTTFVCSSVPDKTAHAVSDVLVTRPGDFAGYAVLDTACQKNVCSKGWLDRHSAALKEHKLHPKMSEEREGFQFGVGAVQFSKEHAYIPVALDGAQTSCCLFGASVLHENCEIPLLLSLPMIERKLQAVIDFPKGCIHFSVFGIDVPIVKINGHICISICEFPAPCEVWSSLSSALDQGDPDLELVRLPAFPTATCVNGREPSASFVVAGMAHCGEASGHRRDDADPPHDEYRAAGAATSVVDCSPGPSAPAAHEHPPRGHCQAVQAPSRFNSKERQPTREFQSMSGMRNPLALRAGSLGRAAILAAAAASAAIGHFFGKTEVGEPIDSGGPELFYDLPEDFFKEPLGARSQGRPGGQGDSEAAPPGHRPGPAACSDCQGEGFFGARRPLRASSVKARPARGSEDAGRGRGAGQDDGRIGGTQGRAGQGFGDSQGGTGRCTLSADDPYRHGRGSRARLRLVPGARLDA